MTSPSEPASTEPTPAGQLTRPLREPAAFVFLGANALLLFVGLLRLLTSATSGAERAGSPFAAFVGLEAVLLPLLAVWLATHRHPVLPRAKLITQVALGQYAVSTVLGALILLIGSVDQLASGEVLAAFLGFLSRLAGLVLLLLAGFVVFRIWRRLYYVPKPKPQPGVYGAPQAGWPAPPPGGQPGAPGSQPSWPGPSQGGGWPTPPQPGALYGQSAAPLAGTSPPAPPFGQPPSVDPTQAIPRQPIEPQAPPHDEDRTRRINPSDSPD